MFRKSLVLVLAILSVVVLSAFTSQMFLTPSPPSAYDTGLTIDKAFKTSKTPLLVEFYSDSCGACRQVAPMLDGLRERYRERLTWVLINTDDAANTPVAQIFGVNELPGVYVFNFKRMKKRQIPSSAFTSADRLRQGVDTALAGVSANPA